ncbi:MAG: CBS domain-containing protein [Chloroflexia bacterium]|nr:CBS domain-containing protein [Chloroflexia bacterium]
MTEPPVTVADIMRHDAPTVTPADSIGAVARMLVEHQVSGLPVVENGEIVGMITEYDLIAREVDVTVPTVVPWLDALLVADGGRDFDDEMRQVLAVTAGELMSSPVINIRSMATLSQVATLMVEQRLSTIPVIDDELSLIGLVTRSDLVRIIARLESLGDLEESGVAGR